MFPEKKIELVHFQLTRKCNLRCSFCGQWGEKGFFSNACGSEMALKDWVNVTNSLIKYRDESGVNPSLMLWGGEPLLFPEFRTISEYLSDNGFALGMVTNGVFLHKYAELIKTRFKKVYISLDGPPNLHDAIRGPGVFEKVSENIKLIQGGKPQIILMTVLTKELLRRIDELPKAFEPLNPDAVLLQDLIYINSQEVGDYCDWLKRSFSMVAEDIFSWESEPPKNYTALLERAFGKLKNTGTTLPYLHVSHGEKAKRTFCLSPFRHIHIAWNGNVLYCTDHYDFSAGNVKNNDLMDIFNNDLSEKFRKEILNGNCATCRHCSWKNNEEFYL